MAYDCLVVGAGLCGATFAQRLAKSGHRVLVIDSDSTVGGNAQTSVQNGITVHEHGAHIFHTNNQRVWDYVNEWSEFNHYQHQPVANYLGKIYNLPFNMNTFSQIWQVTTPNDAKKMIDCTKFRGKITNLDEQARALVGSSIYDRLIAGYTEKQWGKKCTELPASIIRRLPVRFTYDNDYFNDQYQGIPVGGYTEMVREMLDDVLITVRLNCSYQEHVEEFKDIPHIFYTGAIDEFYHYQLGALEYRGLKFHHEWKSTANYQGVSVMNFTDKKVPQTRIIEHRHFDPEHTHNDAETLITYEIPHQWHQGDYRYYPINTQHNNALYKQYTQLAQNDSRIWFAGRLGQYRYYNMDQVIAVALNCADKAIKDWRS